jgi:hypothetical protein
MTTSLLGLQRYLAKRNLSVPDPVARNWLLLGTGFTLLVLISVLLIPRPISSSRLENLFAFWTSPIREGTSKHAPFRDGQKQQADGKPRLADNPEKLGGNNNESKHAEADSKPAETGTPSDSGKNSNRVNEEPHQAKPKPDQAVDQNDQSAQESQDSNRQQQQPSGNRRQPKNDKSNQEQGQPMDRPSDQSKDQQVQENNSPRQGEPRKEPKNGSDKNRRQGDAEMRSGNQPRQPENAAEQPPLRHADNFRGSNGTLQRIIQTISQSFRLLMYVAGGIAIAVLTWLFRDEFARLFGVLIKKTRSPEIQDGPLPPSGPELDHSLFSSFSDPFASGRANSMTVDQIAIYTWGALNALARELGLDRPRDMTAGEFASRLCGLDKRLGEQAAELADVYGRCLFGRDAVSREELRPLVHLWQSMKTLNSRASRSLA